MVGALYKEGDVRRESGFSLFYAGINLGAFLGGVLMIYMGLYYSWNLAFALVGIVMCISLITLFFTKKYMGPIGNSPLETKLPASQRKTREIITYLASLAVIPLILLLIRNTQYTDYFMLIVGPATLLYVFYEMTKLTKAQNMKLFAALIFILFSVLFWGLFEQSGGSLALFARYNVSHEFFGMNIDPNAVNNSSNALFVILLAPIVGLLWVWLSHRKANPLAGAKFGLGFIFLGIGYFIFWMLRGGASAEGLTSLEIFTLAYLLLTIGELCVSPIGLSLMTKLSPMSMQGLMMGMWFLASGFGHYVAGVLGKGIATIPDEATPPQVLDIATSGFKTLGFYGVIAGVALIILTPLLRRLMGTVK
jgi:POT family proton-dependent oligopeptide transporter